MCVVIGVPHYSNEFRAVGCLRCLTNSSILDQKRTTFPTGFSNYKKFVVVNHEKALFHCIVTTQEHLKVAYLRR